MKRSVIPAISLFILASFAACSLAPDNPVTRNELMRTRIYSEYIIQESPEQVLHALNRDGEVVLEGSRNIGGKDYPVHIKLLATSEGIEVVDYDR